MSLNLGCDHVWKGARSSFPRPELKKPWNFPEENLGKRGFNLPFISWVTRVKGVVACVTSGERTQAYYSNSFAGKDSKRNGTAVLKESCGTDTFIGVHTESEKRAWAKNIDVVTLGNLCVDIVLNVPQLPPSSLQEKYRYMQELAASNPDKSYWEAGGNCNFAIAAARLGLQCATLGQVGDEKYGKFLREVLEKEGVNTIGIDGGDDHLMTNNKDYETVLCWVLVDPGRRHGFCSRFDFNKEPAFKWVKKLSVQAEAAIKQSKVLFCNGFVFDELSPSLIVSAVQCARDAGSAIFFDPGPRNKALLQGTPEQRGTLQMFLRMSDVLLLTADEAESLTGLANPLLAAQHLLNRGIFTKWVIIKVGSRGSFLVTSKGFYYAPAFKVAVADTVGCGDSFAAAIVNGYINFMPVITTLALANAVGGATAMGCGAGRNVATMEKVRELLLASELSDEYGDYCKEFLSEGHLSKPEITVLKKFITGKDNSFQAVAVQNVTRDALGLLQKCSQKRSLQMRVNA